MMKQFLPVLLLAIATPAAAAAPVAPPAAASGTPPKTVLCLNNRDIRTRVTTAADGYFAQTSQGWWRNTGAACSAYAPSRTLVTRSIENRQCRGDLVVVVDLLSRMEFGSCALGDWVRVDAPPPKK